MKKTILLFCVLSLTLGQISAQMTIAEARQLAVGATITISGIVTNGSELGTIRYLQDTSAAIGIYDVNALDFLRGDSVTISGVLSEYANLLEVGNLTVYTVHSSGNTLPEPQLVTPIQLDESKESELVTLNQCVFADADSVFASNSSYNFTSNGESSSIFIRSNHPLIGSIIPGNPVTLIGICSQYYTNYQLILRDSADIIDLSLISIISTIQVSNITTNGFVVSWYTDTIGSTGIFYGNTPDFELGKIEMPGLDVFHAVAVSGADPSELFYIKAFSAIDNDTAFAQPIAAICQSISTGNITQYFTASVDQSVSTGEDALFIDDAIDDTLINYMNRATESIDVAIYDFNNLNISDIAGALNGAFNNGIEVRVIYDTSWTDVDMGSLLEPNIHKMIAPASSDYGIMHNKFVIFDAKAADPNLPLVWTGSTNFEDENINKFANNVTIIQDKSLAITYWLEFNEMWGTDEITPVITDSRFGPYKTDNTPHNFIIAGNIPLECYFSPSDGTNSRILEVIENADYELYIETMLITRSDIAYKINDTYDNGCDVKAIVNLKDDCSSTVVNILDGILGNDFKEYGELGILHNKFVIADPNSLADDPVVLTGTHNWSNSAENKNDENTLVIHDARVANLFYQEFTERFKHGLPLGVHEIVKMKENALFYPNPSKNVLNMDYQTEKAGETSIELYNYNSQLVSSQFIYFNEGKSTIQLDVANLPAGIYFVKIQSDSHYEVQKIEILH